MPKKPPLKTVRIEENRVHFVMGRLKHKRPIGIDGEYFTALEKLWNAFLKSPSSVNGIAMTEEFYPHFHHLESVARDAVTISQLGNDRYCVKLKRGRKPATRGDEHA